MNSVELVADCRNTLGEGILWDERSSSLFWTDIEEYRLYRWQESSGVCESMLLPERLGSFAFCEDGRFLFAFASGLALGGWGSETFEWITVIHEPDSPVRLNDGRCDSRGRFIVGDYDPASSKRGEGYSISGGGKMKRLFSGLDSANSTCFSPDGSTMYFTDSTEREIWAYDYDLETGIPSGKRVFASFEGQPGLPDGSIVDSEGYLWNAQWGGYRIVRFSPSGEVDRVIELPVKNITCICFGGEPLDTLYITSARLGLTPEELEEQPLHGGVFSVKCGCTGLPEQRFRP